MKLAVKLPKITKKIETDKAEPRTIIFIAIMVTVAVFCLVGSKQLLSLASYQRKVINSRNKALGQINKNLTAANDLIKRYQVFNSINPNIIGGKNTSDPGAQPPDGDNGRIVLDALPSKYDFPALISSVYKIMANNSISGPSVSASDQSLTISFKPQPEPKAVIIPLIITGGGDYNSILSFINDLERSIRPFDVTSLQLTGSNSNMTFSMSVNTYFQPARIVDTTTREIK